MNTISFNLGFICFFSLIVWVFLSNDMYLKLFFLKGSKKRNIYRRESNPDDIFFDSAFGGETIPQYIKHSISKCQDKYQLISLYLASKSLINIKVFNLFMGNKSNDFEKMYIDMLSSKIGIKTYIAFCWARWISLLLFLIMFGVFLNSLGYFNSKRIEIDFSSYYFLMIIAFSILMPYGFYSRNIAVNKIFCVSVFMASLFISFVNVYSVASEFSSVSVHKFYAVTLINMIIILIGAYAFISYSKFEYMSKFFELLKVNLEQSSNVDHSTPLPTVTVPSQSTSS